LTRPDGYAPGTPSWVDLGSPDVDASASFYGALFGWTAQQAGPVEETGGYTMFERDGLPVAGLAPIMNEGQHPAWTSYVTVTDADETAGKVAAAGGQALMTPMDVLDVGRMALFADPAGAVFAVWQPGRHKGAGIVNEPGALTWTELATTDTAAAARFYAAVFGWGAEEEDMDGGRRYTQWQLGGRSIGGMLEMGPDFPPGMPPHWLAYFAVEDAEAAIDRAAGLGATVRVPAMTVPAGTFGVLTDPQGALFAVIALAREPG
jgi:predicted enzyme related to lactoylglutathione lyase